MPSKLLAIVISLLLAGCSEAANSGRPASNLPQSIGPGEGALNLLAWAGYVESGKIDPNVDWVTPFESQTGCKINVRVADTSDAMVALMRQGGGTQWDGVSAGGDISNHLIAHGDVAEVNVNLIPDFVDVVPALQSPRHNTVNGHHYGVPIVYGPNVLMYNTTVVKPAPATWKDTWEASSPYRGRVAAYDNPMSIADAALYLKAHDKSLGITDIFELTPAQLDAATALLKQQAPVVNTYWAAPLEETDAFSRGDLVIGTAWPSQVSVLKSAGRPVASVIPAEGATGWADTWMMSSHARHPNCMYLWMKWTERPDVQAQVAEFYGGTPSNSKACGLFRQGMGATADRDYHCGDGAFLKHVAFWKTPLQQCSDGRGATCTDYMVWQERWKAIRGAA